MSQNKKNSKKVIGSIALLLIIVACSLLIYALLDADNITNKKRDNLYISAGVTGGVGALIAMSLYK